MKPGVCGVGRIEYCGLSASCLEGKSRTHARLHFQNLLLGRSNSEKSLDLLLGSVSHHSVHWSRSHWSRSHYRRLTTTCAQLEQALVDEPMQCERNIQNAQLLEVTLSLFLELAVCSFPRHH